MARVSTKDRDSWSTGGEVIAQQWKLNGRENTLTIVTPLRDGECKYILKTDVNCSVKYPSSIAIVTLTLPGEKKCYLFLFFRQT